MVSMRIARLARSMKVLHATKALYSTKALHSTKALRSMKALRPLPRLALVGFLLLPVGLILLPMGVGGVVPPQSQPDKMAAQTGASFRPGDIVGEEVVARRGVSSFFSVSKISDSVFERMRGRSYKEGCRVAREDLRYLLCLHKDAQGRSIVGEMVVNRAIANDVLEILRKLYDAHYPIERMRLIDDYGADDERSMAANNSSAFNYRITTGSTKLSAHARGLAVDINPLYNPCRRTVGGKVVVEPRQGRKYLQREAKFPYKIAKGDLCYRLFTARGFVWGGNWRTVKDYQHFEIRK